MKGATSTALNTIVSGKGDPAQAIGNYIAYAGINMAGTSVAQAAKDAYKLLTTDTDAAKAAQDKYTTLKAELDQKITDGEKLRTTINDDSAAYQKTLTEQYNPYKEKLDGLIAENSKAVDDFNTNKKLYDDNKWAYDNYDAKLRQLGYEAFSDENGTSYGKRVGAVQKAMWDPESGYYMAWVPDGTIVDSEGYPTWRMVYDAPSQQSFAEAANAAATKANAAGEVYTSTKNAADKLVADNKDMVDGLVASAKTIETNMASLQKIRDDVEKPNADGKIGRAHV